MTRFVAGFIGESNLLPVEMRDGAAVHAGQAIRVQSQPTGRGPHSLVVRPERIRPAMESDANTNVLTATLTDVVYQGDSFVCYAALNSGNQIFFRDFCRNDVLSRLPRPGETVRLAIDPADAVVVSDEV